MPNKRQLLSIPEELKKLNTWVGWKAEYNRERGKDDKKPINPKNGKFAKINDSSTWGTYNDALESILSYKLDGVGFVFTDRDNYVGIDIDRCRDKETGTLSEIAKEIVARLASYTEVSPSGTGVHILVKGQLPPNGRRNSKYDIEIYNSGRYFTVTGTHLEGTPLTIEERTKQVKEIHDKYIAKNKQPQKPGKQEKEPSVLSDEEMLQKAVFARNGQEFQRLWNGDWEDKYPSQSEADLALCSYLAFWTARNAEAMNRLFRKSKLYREKWDKPHYSDGTTYGAYMIKMAVDSCVEVYNPNKKENVYIIEKDNRYIKVKGDGGTFELSNFLINPVELVQTADEAELVADVVTASGQTFRKTFMTRDFANVMKFKNVLNQNAISLCFMGKDADLEQIKGIINEKQFTRKRGTKTIGMFEVNPEKWVFAGNQICIDASGNEFSDLITVKKWLEIKTCITDIGPITKDELLKIGRSLLGYNEPSKTASILGYCAGCFLKEKLRKLNIKFNHLIIVGEAGSGKSQTVENMIMQIFCTDSCYAAEKSTPFASMKTNASSNCIPHIIEEFKPSKMQRSTVNTICNLMRDSYDWHDGQRGRPDLTVETYTLSAPIILVGEEAPNEASIKERSIELLFSKTDIKDRGRTSHFNILKKNKVLLNRLGRSLLDTALNLPLDELERSHKAVILKYEKQRGYPPRVINAIANCMVGLALFDDLCRGLGLSFEEVTGSRLEDVLPEVDNAMFNFLLDGTDYNKSVIDNTFEVFDRMNLVEGIDYQFINDRTEVAFDIRNVYDRFTKYIKDHALADEFLNMRQFMRQLKKTAYYLDYRSVRFEDKVRKVFVLDLGKLFNACEMSNINTG